MEAGASSGQEVLQLRAVLRSISPLIWRRLLVRGDPSVAQLHQVLQVAFGWQDMHLHRFEILVASTESIRRAASSSTRTHTKP